MVRTLKDVGPYSDYTYIDYLEEDGVRKDSINYGTTRVARGASPSYPPIPANPFAPEPWTDIFVSEATIGYNKTFSRTCSYESAAIMKLGAAGGGYFQDQNGTRVSSIDITGGGNIMNYGCENGNNYALFLLEINNPINIYYYFDTSMGLFNKFYINGNEVPVRTRTVLPNKSCTLTGTVYTPKWKVVHFNNQWSQEIYQQIMSGQTCLSGDSMASFEYMMGDPKTDHFVGLDFYTDGQSGNTIVMPFVTDPNGLSRIISYHCYTSSDLSAGTWAVLDYTLPYWSEIHRHGNTTQVDYLIKDRCNLTTNEFYDGIYALANGIDPGRPLPS